jgi:tRNA U34 5-carboxymethylaminomethyl modifying GTPase MnmE/TrmE
VICASRLRSALEKLKWITGDEYQEDMLDQIFSTFCIGK